MFWGIGNVPVDRDAAVEPALELVFKQPVKDMVIDGARAYVLGEDDLIIMDISSADSLRTMGCTGREWFSVGNISVLADIAM